MKLSVRDCGFREPPGEFPVTWALGRAKELGYDGIELCMVPDRGIRGKRATRRGCWYADYDSDERKALRAHAERLGLEIPTLATSWAWSYSELNPELRQWERGVEIIGEDVEFARDVGARVILIHFGVSRGSWEDAKSVLGRAAGYAARRGIVLGVEGNIWPNVGLGSQATLCQMVDEIGSPGLQVYVHPQGDTAKQIREIREAGKRMCALHSSALDPSLDYGQIFAAIQEVGYDWFWCFEVNGEVIAESAPQWRSLAKQFGVS
jgi:sugar phosphate isomerase/epimerase